MSCAIAALAATSVGATTKSLRSTNKDQKRNLSYEYIAGYLPNSSVTDHNAIDLDQKIIVEQVSKLTESSFALAKKVYAEGGHSKSYAKLTITNGVTPNYPDGTLLSGVDNENQEVVGKVYKSSSTPAGQIWIQYQTTDVQSSYVGCQVGALAATGDHNTSGCLKPTGSLTGSGTTIEYSHDNLQDTKNGRTIRGFSTAVESKMLTCAKCPYDDAGYFNKYYGVPSYADTWISAAFDGTKTSFPSGRGDADFSTYSLKGRGECAKKGTAYMSVFMYVIREFEDALDDCKASCISCNDDPVHAWDEGVAFYSGSLEEQDGLSDGQLLHQLADKRCKNFNTCANESNTYSNVNKELLQLFNVGQGQLQAGQCEDARETTAKVVDLMYIPLIQGTLRYAYKVDKLSGGEKEKAEGAVFAAAVLPRIFAEDEEAAQTIYDSMKVGAASTDFKKVKKAFEGVYDELGIECSHIGGLMDDATGDYYDGAEPCKDSIGGGGIAGIIIGSVAGGVALVAIGYIFYMRARERDGNPVFKAAGAERPV